jgi:hypothetical protein
MKLVNLPKNDGCYEGTGDYKDCWWDKEDYDAI